MPALFALEQHRTLAHVQEQLRDDEYIFAYLDDIYALCEPDRVSSIFAEIREALLLHAGIRINLGKTKVWNAAGAKPTDVEAISEERG